MWVNILNYPGYNGILKSQELKNELNMRAQHIILSGVGTHRQNGVIECTINSVVNSTMTMMLHQTLMWP